MKKKLSEKNHPQPRLPEGMFFMQINNEGPTVDRYFKITTDETTTEGFCCICDLDLTDYRSLMAEGFRRLPFTNACPEEKVMRKTLAIKWEKLPVTIIIPCKISSRKELSLFINDYLKKF